MNVSVLVWVKMAEVGVFFWKWATQGVCRRYPDSKVLKFAPMIN